MRFKRAMKKGKLIIIDNEWQGRMLDELNSKTQIKDKWISSKQINKVCCKNKKDIDKVHQRVRRLTLYNMIRRKKIDTNKRRKIFGRISGRTPDFFKLTDEAKKILKKHGNFTNCPKLMDREKQQIIKV